MINRRASAYYELPPVMTKGSKQKDAKLNMSFGMVIPPEIEKKADKFMKEEMDKLSKDFRKFMDKQCDKLLDEDY